jgi:hypothetical protein
MAVAGVETEYHFNTHDALRKLLRGVSPTTVFVHPIFPDKLPCLSEEDLKVGRLSKNADIKKAMVGVLQSAASADIAHAFLHTSIPASSQRGRYSPGIKATVNLIDACIFPQFEETVRPAFYGVLDAYHLGSIQAPLLDRLIAIYGPLLEPAPSVTRMEVGAKFSRNRKTLDLYTKDYTHILADLFEIESKKRPDVSELSDLIEHSTSIIGAMAVRSTQFLLTASFVLTGDTRPTVNPYNPTDFQLTRRPDGKLSGKIRRNVREKFESEYPNTLRLAPRDEPFLVTGCPAASDLIELVLQRYAQAVRNNAEGNYNTYKTVE